MLPTCLLLQSQEALLAAFKTPLLDLKRMLPLLDIYKVNMEPRVFQKLFIQFIYLSGRKVETKTFNKIESIIHNDLVFVEKV